MFDLVSMSDAKRQRKITRVRDLLERCPINEIINNNGARIPVATPNYRLILHEPVYYPF